MLTRLLQELAKATGPLDLNELSRKLGVERSALDGMIAYLVQRGKLRDDDQELAAAQACCSSGGCGSCPGAQGCPFAVKMPRSYSLPAKATPTDLER